MADNASHNYDLSFVVGDEGAAPRTKLSVSIAVGGNTQDAGQTELTSAFGTAASLFTPYLVFRTESEAQAAALAAFLTQEYEAAKTRAQGGPGYMEDALGFAIAMMSAFGEPDMVQLEISNHGNNAIIKAVLSEKTAGVLKGALEGLKQLFESALSTRSEVEFHIESGAGVDAILRPDTAVDEFTRHVVLAFKGVVTLAACETVRNVLPLPSAAKKALDAIAPVFRDLTVKLNFKDFSHLPEDVKGALNVSEVLAAAPMLIGMIGGDNKRLIKDAVAKGAQSFEAVILGEYTLAKVFLQFLGVEQLL